MDEWHEINDSTYRLRLTGIYDVVDSLEGLEHVVYLKLNDSAEEAAFNTYVNLRSTDFNGFVSTTGTDTSRFNIISTTSIKQEESYMTFSVYPNPTIEEFQISGLQKDFEAISILNMDGKLMLTFHENETIFNVSMLPPGTYFIQVAMDDIAETKKFIKL